MATWDDHDYGLNDAGRDFVSREASELMFEEFWHVPRLARDRPGIYRSVMLGEAQWAWLEQTLQAPAELRVIASSMQVLAEHHGWES